MRYLGGKSKIRKQVASSLESVREPEQTYLESFVGGGWTLQEMICCGGRGRTKRVERLFMHKDSV